MSGQLALLQGLDPHPTAGDDLERVYTPDSLALAAVRGLDLTPSSRIVEGHVGGGAWVRAVRRVVGEGPEVLAIDLDPDARGLQRDDVVRLHADFLSQRAMTAIDAFGTTHLVGNPPFSEARDQLEELAAWALLDGIHVAWILPIDLWSNQAWASTLGVLPPARIRPITRRVWTCVRGVALWEWIPGSTRTVVEPLSWRGGAS